MAESARHLVGIDDTDDADSRGTGHLVRDIGARIAASGLAEVHGISRHQLFFDPRIPYTSHNSSLCLDADIAPGRAGELAEYCRGYLRAESAPGADAGLCIVAWSEVSDDVIAFGRRAKTEIVTQQEARALAAREGILLEGLTGDEGGVIGALAAVGLRRTDNDGRFNWRRGMREAEPLISVEKLLRTTGIDAVESVSGRAVNARDVIDVRPWPRAILAEGRAVLLVEEAGEENGNCDWRLARKDIIKRY
ncbi:MAG TPA: hypothetical protein VGU20_08395 [Stellaceae bacterium]|nr:hypothetical protein [Stellaceae bacterium]